MATYLLFGKYSAEASRNQREALRRTQKALFKKHGGELKAAYATLGGVDLVMIADLPDNRARWPHRSRSRNRPVSPSPPHPRSRWMSSTSSRGWIATSSPGRVSAVMAGLVPAIHVLLVAHPKTWMPGTRPDMTAWVRSGLSSGFAI